MPKCEFCGGEADFRFSKGPTAADPRSFKPADYCRECYQQRILPYGEDGYDPAEIEANFWEIHQRKQKEH